MRETSPHRSVLMLAMILALGCGCSSTSTLNVDAQPEPDGPSAPDGPAADLPAVQPDGPAADLPAKKDYLLADAPPQQPCEPAVEVSTEAQLVAQLEALTWQWVGPYSSTPLVVSDDVKVIGEVLVDAAKLTVPANCAGRSDCRHEVAFIVPQGMAGVTCKATVDVVWFQACRELSLKDTTLRFLAMMQDTHPSTWNFVPLIQLKPDCAAPCAADTFRCGTNNLCYASFESHCQLCLGLDKQICPCLTPDGPVDDGTDCNFMVSGDVVCQGKCEDGFCEHTGEPGWAGCP